ncbi:SDR family NAD(P)-dependent oxidoreductase [Chloroflexota bacterium]
MNKPSFSLEGRTAIVTGGKGVIGKEIAITLADAGADVAVCSREIKDGQLEAVAKEIRKLGRRSLSIQADVSKKADVDNMVQRVVDEFGRIDILVNCAAMIIKKFLLDVTEEDYDEVLDTDLKGCFLCSQAAARIMVKQKGGNIINISSCNAVKPVVKSGTYSASKAGLDSLTQTLARELGSYRIRANCVFPGLVKSKMSRGLWEGHPEFLKEFVDKSILGRLCEASDVAAAVLFLASEASNHITGTTIDVSGGLLLV